MSLSNESVIHIKKNGIEYLQFRKLLEYPNIVHLFSLGLENNFRTNTANNDIDKESYEKAINDYKKFTNEINVDYRNIIKPSQKHTDKVAIVDRKINKEKPDINMIEYANTDGSITNKKEILLASTSADCILMLFFDPVKNVIANVHSGWKGTLQRISVKTVEKMVKEYGSEPKNIICCICPSIRKCHFTVKSDVEPLFRKEFQDLGEQNLKNIIEETEPQETWNIDTVLINKIILMKQGLKEENIIDSGICTVCNSSLMHSYRVERKDYGLNTAIIGIK